MAQLNNPVEILNLLNKSNCRRCGEPTCLAFAAEVFKGRKQIDKCPHLGSTIIKKFGGRIEKPVNNELERRDVHKIIN
jgi:ArsR family metal-binding transcriptional regulator